MGRTILRGLLTASVAVALAPVLGGCLGPSVGRPETPAIAGNTTDRDCLVRAMYFESNRSSHDGLMAVGTVVMNRVASRRFPNTVCGVVGQDGQFAPGVMTRPLDPRQVQPAQKAADAILRGERYAPVGRAMHFHMASFENPYPAKYVAVAGGNAFYLKPGQRLRERLIASKKPEVVTASATSSAVASPAVATADTAASDSGLLQRIYGLASATPPGSPCGTAAAGFGGTSLACEDELSGR